MLFFKDSKSKLKCDADADAIYCPILKRPANQAQESI